MRILFVAATLKELKPILLAISDEPTGRHIIKWVITGVGMIATTYQLTKILQEEEFDLAINIGIAGAFDRSIKLGEVVEVVKDQFSEELVEDGVESKSFEEIGLREKEEASFKNGVLYNSFNWLKSKSANSSSQMKKVSSITVNTVHGNNFSIERIKERLNPQVETMEGAAFFYVCNQMEIPTMQFRAISNYIERRKRANWEIELALENLAKEVKLVMDKLQ